MKEILSGNTPEKWEEIRLHPFYAEELRTLRAFGEQYLSAEIPSLRYTLFGRFMRDGNRREYEAPYFERRRRLARLAVLVKLDGEKYLDTLCDYLWAIMDEATWALPSHLKEVPACQRETHLDLFATETGALLAETYYLLGELLPEDVRHRIEKTVRARIITPYLTRRFWWMYGPNNWGAVCSYQVALCLFYLGTEEEFMRAEMTLHRTMELFLSSYGSDGCCREGLSYWSYGFGSFLCYADAVRNYSEAHRVVSWTEGNLPAEGRDVARDPVSGVVDYFKREDVRRAALFPANMQLHGDTAVSFSDGNMKYTWHRSLFYIIDREYPGLLRYPSVIPSLQSPSAGSLGILRHFLWSNPQTSDTTALSQGTVYYEDAAWFIRRTARYSLAAKGGHNDEPHNHNDLGTFLLSTDEGQVLCDFGCGEYTKQYFEDATRYSYLVNASRGHSVPLVNGCEQVAGKMCARVLTQTDTSFAVSFAEAYPDASLGSLVRRWDCDADGVTLSDRFSFTEAPTALVERFVSAIEPQLCDGEVRIGGVRLLYDAARLCATVTAEDYSDHAGQTATAYLIDLTAKAPQEIEEYVFRILV